MPKLLQIEDLTDEELKAANDLLSHLFLVSELYEDYSGILETVKAYHKLVAITGTGPRERHKQVHQRMTRMLEAMEDTKHAST